MSEQLIDARQRELLQRLNGAVATNDVAGFQHALDSLLATRDAGLQADVARLSDTLLGALTRFRMDSRIAQLAGREIPDARQRLDHVVNLTEDAAHRTLDLIEQSVPLAEATARTAAALGAAQANPAELASFLEDARRNCDVVRRNLSEVMLAQGFQDITGQILRGVQRLIGDVEGVLAQLMELAGVDPALQPAHGQDPVDPARLEGPAIPGVTRNAVTDQGAIDDLMADLGI